MSSLISALAVQKYELTLPTSKKKVVYRPFLVKEEKMLLLASETKNEADIFRAMKEVVSACTFGSIEVEECPIIDIEYLFIKIRCRSVGETATPTIKCANCGIGSECKIDISKIEPSYNSTHTNRIKLSDSVILDMRYPRFSDFESAENKTSDLEKAIDLLTSCIEKVHTKEQIFNTNELDRSEIEEFVSNFTQEQLKLTMSFMETMPKLISEIDFDCSKCQHKEKIKLEGIKDFF